VNDGTNVVIIGDGFIALETAACIASKPGKSVTLISKYKQPFHMLGDAVGEFFGKLHVKKGIKFIYDAKVQRFEGKDVVTNVVLDTVTLPADVVLVAIGAIPNTGFTASDKKITRSASGGIVVDQYLRNSSGVLAAGDICEYPYHLTGQHVRIEHWHTALAQGRHAAKTMLGKLTPYHTIPFFWSAQYGAGLRVAGHLGPADQIILDTKVEDGKILAYFVTKGQVTAIAAYAENTPIAALALYGDGKFPTPSEVVGVDIVQLLQSKSIPIPVV